MRRRVGSSGGDASGSAEAGTGNPGSGTTSVIGNTLQISCCQSVAHRGAPRGGKDHTLRGTKHLSDVVDQRMDIPSESASVPGLPRPGDASCLSMTGNLATGERPTSG